jgi:ATP-dependent Clp protease ATP-binding subunit ClpB
MDDGRLTDGMGSTVDFRNTILIMTSNVGSSYILELSERNEVERRCEEALRVEFRPEFLNRIDSILIFQRLTRERIRGIVDIQLQRLAPILRERQLRLSLTDAAKDRLAELGYDPAFGARPLKRILREHVLEPLSEELIAGRVQTGDTVEIDTDSSSHSLTLKRVERETVEDQAP